LDAKWVVNEDDDELKHPLLGRIRRRRRHRSCRRCCSMERPAALNPSDSGV
jgi:hypothetical protein